jgi:hypothetical protein
VKRMHDVADRVLTAVLYVVCAVSLFAAVAVFGSLSGWAIVASPAQPVSVVFAALVAGCVVWQVAVTVADEKTRVLRAKVDMWDKADTRADLDEVRAITGEHLMVEPPVLSVEEADS